MPLSHLLTSLYNPPTIQSKRPLSLWDLRLTYPRYEIRVWGEGASKSFSQMKEHIGVSAARERGLTGEGVVVGIVDTGVDFAAPALGLDALARDEQGRPLTLDSDQLGFALTPIEARTVSNVSKLLDIKGEIVEVYIPLGIVAEFELEYTWTAPPLPSKSGVYKFGFLVEFSTFSNLIFDFEAPPIGYMIPVILVDSEAPGVYDTVYLDLSSTWFMVGSYLYSFGALATPPSMLLLDFSFSNELPLRYGSELAARDVDNDGTMDFSAGIISGYVYDAFGLIGAVNETGRPVWEAAWEYIGSGIYPGLDPEGNYVTFFYDPIGHGTSVASIIAGRPSKYTYPGELEASTFSFEGIAPKAKIAGATAVFAGDVVTAQLWLSGHDYNGSWNWTYTGKPRVDIINNSWGLLAWYMVSAFGVETFLPGVDPISEYEDYIVERTGTIIVHAAGNQGPGYGTISAGSSSRLAITVGASTFLAENIYFWDGDLMLPRAVNDQVISWSSRGPLPYTQVKPDLVAPGAYAIVPSHTMCGLGDGSRSLDLFGGTSMASPVTAGSIALLLEYSRGRGMILDYWTLKSTLKSTADPLGFDPYAEGAGRINITKALEALEKGLRGVVVSEVTLPYNPIPLREGRSITFRDSTIYLYLRPGENPWEIVEAYGFESPPKVRAYTYTLTYNMSLGPFQAIGRKYIPITLPEDTLNAQLVTVVVSYNVSEYLPGGREGDYTPDKTLAVFLGYWSDLNNNSKIEFSSEFQFLTHGPGIVNRMALDISSLRLPEGAKLAVAVKSLTKHNLTVNVEVRGYNLTEVPWVALRSVEKTEWGYRLTIEASEPPRTPGLYEGYVEFSDGNLKTRVPLQILVPITLDSEHAETLSTMGENYRFQNWILENPSFYGTPPSGDWRYYVVESAGLEEALAARVEWGSLNSSVEVLGLGRTEDLTGVLTSGRLSPTGLISLVPPYTPTYYVDENYSTSIVLSQENVYIIALHHTISSGDPERLRLTLAPLRVNYRISRSGIVHALITCEIPLGAYRIKSSTWTVVGEHRGGAAHITLPLLGERATLELLEQPTISFQAELWGLTYSLYVEKVSIELRSRLMLEVSRLFEPPTPR